MPNFFEKFTKNKPLFYGSLGVLAIGGIVYYRHKSAQAAASTATGTVTDPDGNVCSALNPTTGFCPGTPGDQAALQQMSGSFVGQPFGGGSSGTPGIDTGGGATGNPAPDLSTKEAWVAEAENVLPNGQSAEVRNALLGVLGGLTVTRAERDIFLMAVGVLGDPPGGYPKPIKTSDTGGHPGPGPGPKKVTVPNVKGEPWNAARAKLRAANLQVRVNPGDEKNHKTVQHQSPNAGAKVNTGTIVHLT